MGTFPPMSNSKLVEEAGKHLLSTPFNTVQERLSQDELTAEQEEENESSSGRNPGNIPNCTEAGAGKMKA